MPDFDEESWRQDRILAQPPGDGGEDAADEVVQTEAQNFGGTPDGSDPVPNADSGEDEGEVRRGPGRPRKPKPDGPAVRTKSVRVELELEIYAQVKMRSWTENKAPGLIVAELVEEHFRETTGK